MLELLAVETLKPTELPSPPKGALDVVHACTRDDKDVEQLSALVGRDPVLSAELLRIANSAYFGFASEINSVARAINIIGHQALRNIALCIAVRDTLKPDQLPGFPLGEFWEATLRRAVCARSLAGLADLDAETGFTVGLLQDFGLLVLFYLNQNRISEWSELASLTPEQRQELELELFGVTHDKIGLRLAKAWGLPQELEAAIGFHHHSAERELPEQTKRFCDLALCADWMAAVFTAEDKRHAIPGCRMRLQQRFELSAEGADLLLDEVSANIKLAASAFGFEIGKQTGYDVLIREANLRLVEENLSVQEMNWRLQRILDERDQVSAELNRELALAREVQRSLLPSEAKNHLGLAGINVSAKMVSGDFYDFFALPNGQVVFCIADVAGKGMNAALLMAKTSSLFHCLGKSVHDPGKLLAMLNREILETAIHGMFVTMLAGCYDPARRHVRLANAGHLPAVRMNEKVPRGEYPANAPPLGVVPNVAFGSVEFALGNDSLYLYTDGLLEVRVSEQQRLGQEGLLALFSKYAVHAPQERLQRIIAEVRAHPAGIEDDLTLLLIEH